MATDNKNQGSAATAAAAPPKKTSLLKIIFGTLAALVAVLLVVISIQPSEFRIARSTTISAPPATVFPLVNDFHKWTWNPWGKIDPAMKQTYEGAPAGVGAIYTWIGNNEVGEGKMTIIDSRPNEFVQIRLEFIKPFAGTNTAEFTVQPVGEQTTVTWSMAGEQSFLAKAIHLVMDLDKMIGGQFDKGLVDLKAIAEAAPADERENPAAAAKEEAN